MSEPVSIPRTLLAEGFKITDQASAEIQRIAARDGRDASDVELEVIQFLKKQRSSKVKLNQTVQVTRSHVVKYDVGTKVFSPQLFYYDEFEGFVNLTIPEDGAGVDVDDGDVKFDLDAGGERDEDEEEREEDEELEDDEEVLGDVDAAHLRKSGRALISKSVKLKGEDGAETTLKVPLDPLATFYQLLPRQALIDHIVHFYKQSMEPLVKEVTRESGNPAQADARRDAVLRSVTDKIEVIVEYLKLKTCLADFETDHIVREFLGKLKSAGDLAFRNAQTKGRTLTAAEVGDIVAEVSDAMTRAKAAGKSAGVIQVALRRRTDSSKLISFLEGGQVTRNQRIEMEAQTRRFSERDASGEIKTTTGISSNYISKFARKIESLMDFTSVNFDPQSVARAQSGERETTVMTGETGEVAYSNADVEQTKGAAVTSRRGFKQLVTAANQEDDALASLFSGPGRIPGLSIIGSNRTTGGLDVQRVTVKVRSGETRETLYSSMQDRRDLRIRLRTNSRGVEKLNASPTDPRVILRSVRSTIELFNAEVSDSDPTSDTQDSAPIDSLTRAERAASLASNLSGLVEYMAMSGLDVLDERGKQFKDRSALIEISRRIQLVALDLISKVAKTHVQVEIGNQTMGDSIALAKNRTELQALRAEDASVDEIRAVEGEIERLSQRINSRSTAKARSDLWQDTARARRKIESLDADTACYRYYESFLRVDDDVPSVASTLTLDLAQMRGQRTVLLGRQLRAAVTRDANAAEKQRDLSDLKDAGAVYESRVLSTMFRLLSKNKVKYHLLRPTDTIDSICREYGIGERTDAKKIEVGKALTMPLPDRLRMGSRAQQVYVTDVSVGKNPEVTLLLDNDRSEIKLPRSEILAILATHETGDSLSEAREEFKRTFTHAVGETFGAIRDDSLRPDEPILPKLAEGAYQDMRRSAEQDLNAHLRDLSERASFRVGQAQGKYAQDLFASFDPASSNESNDRLVHTLRVLCVLARRLFRDASQMDSAVAGAFPRAGPDASRFASIAVSDPSKPAVKSVMDDVRALQSSEAGARGDQFLERLEEILVVMRGVARERENLSVIVRKFEAGQLIPELIGNFSEMPIPVPAPQNILTPGTVITIAEPNRSLTERGLDVVQALGISPRALISPAVNGVMSAIKSVTQETLFSRVVVQVAAEIGAVMADRFVQAAAGKVPDQKIARVKVLFAAQIEDILRRNFPRDGFLTSSSGSSGDEDVPELIAKLYSSSAAQIATEDSIPILPDADRAAISHAIDIANDHMRALFKLSVEQVCKTISTPDGIRALQRIAPCLATFLSRRDVSEFSSLCLKVLESSAGELMSRMTAAHRRSLVGSIEGEKSSDSMSESLLSSGADRIGAIVNIINSDYSAMEDEPIDVNPDARGWDPRAKKVIVRAARAIRETRKMPAKDPVPVPEIARFFGLSAMSSVDQINQQAIRVKDAIDREVSSLSASAAGGALRSTLSEIVGSRVQGMTNAADVVRALSGGENKKFSEVYTSLKDAVVREMPTQVDVVKVEDILRDRLLPPGEIIAHMIDRAAEESATSLISGYASLVKAFNSQYVVPKEA